MTGSRWPRNASELPTACATTRGAAGRRKVHRAQAWVEGSGGQAATCWYVAAVARGRIVPLLACAAAAGGVDRWTRTRATWEEKRKTLPGDQLVPEPMCRRPVRPRSKRRLTPCGRGWCRWASTPTARAGTRPFGWTGCCSESAPTARTGSWPRCKASRWATASSTVRAASRTSPSRGSTPSGSWCCTPARTRSRFRAARTRQRPARPCGWKSSRSSR